MSALPLLTEDETRKVLVDWNNTEGEYSSLSFPELFAEHARRRPDAPAVQFQGTQLTYAELDRLAEQCAQRLLKSGLAAEAPVAVMLERGPEVIVSLLGILKAGGAYLPLDPAYPSERLAYMLEDARPHVLLTSKSLLNRVPWTNVPIVSRIGRRKKQPAKEQREISVPAVWPTSFTPPARLAGPKA